MEFVFTANSPGEVATWLVPMLRAVKARAPASSTSVFLVPCAFATGAETDVVRAMPEADRVFGPGEYWRVALGLRRYVPSQRRGRPEGALLYLGGDLIHALWLSRRLRLPALAYVERGSGWTRAFSEVLVPDEQAKASVLRRGDDPARVRVVGNLMLDAVSRQTDRAAAAANMGLDAERPVLAVFPGSRPYEIQLTLPFFLRAAEIVRADYPNVQWVISLSAFGSPELLHAEHDPALGGTASTVTTVGDRWIITTERGLEAIAVQGRQYDIMHLADVALTVPGSNTVEMSAAQLPMIVALPLNVAEEIPLPGAAQYVEKLPVVGTRWKRAFVHRRVADMPFVAWPNRKAGEAVVPEVRGNLRPEDVALETVRLLADVGRRRAMRERLRQVMGPTGAAARMTERLLAAAGGDGGE